MTSGIVPSAEVEAALKRVLESATFGGADRSRRLLRFIVQQTMEGHADRLKDYTLGAEALGRGDEFDPRTDPSARAEASRLRSRLDLYYGSEGAKDEVKILIPKGGYVPVFERRAPAESSSSAPAEQPAGTSPGPERRSQGWRSVWVPLVAAAMAGSAAWVAGGRIDRRPMEPETRVELNTPATTDPASLAISPDGRTIAFVASDADVPRLWARDLGTGRAQAIAGTEYASLPFWSPDGRAIGFFAEGQIRAIDLQSHVVRTLSTAPVPAGAAWNIDGVILHPLVPDSPLYRTTEKEGSLVPATALTAGQTGHRGPTFLPDGRRFLFYAAGNPPVRGIYVGELGNSRVVRLLDADTPAVFVPPGHLLYVQHGSLLACAFDAGTATITGEPVAIAGNVDADPSAGLAALSASRSGTIAYRTGTVGTQRRFVRVDRQGRELAPVGAGVAEQRGPSYGAISPDGRRLAVQRSMDGNTDIWLVDLDRGTPVRFTTEPEPDIAPAWSPTGDRIGYASLVDGVFQLFERSLKGGDRRLLVQTPNPKQITDWSRDGRYVLYRSVTQHPTFDTDIWALQVDGDHAPFPVVRTPFEERDAQFSPDGRWIAYQSKESGRYEIYVHPFSGDGERLRISTDGGVQVRWRGDGRELFYLAPDGKLMAITLTPMEDGRSLRAGVAVPLFQARVGAPQGLALHSYAVGNDGRRFLLDSLVEQQAAPIALILNWQRAGR
jgi:Tol biopolymer transport system component